MARKVEFTASDLAGALKATGRVAVRSILFASNATDDVRAQNGRVELVRE